MATRADRSAAPAFSDDPTLQTEVPPSSKGRTADGRFARGNSGGPWNTFARTVAELRCAFIGAVEPEDLQRICRRLITMAAMGDLAAAKLVLGYLLGRVPEPVNPDTLNQQECKMYKENMSCAELGEVVQHRPPAELSAGILRANEIANYERAERVAQQIKEEDQNHESHKSHEKENPNAAEGARELDADSGLQTAQETGIDNVPTVTKRQSAEETRHQTVDSNRDTTGAAPVRPSANGEIGNRASGVASAPRMRADRPPLTNGRNGGDRAPAPSTIGSIGAPDAGIS